ncbi:MAG: ATP-binding protein [Coriobacteriia bacterium]
MTDSTKRWAESYRARLALGYVLVVALLAAAWAWSLYGPLTDAVIEQQQSHLQSVAQAGALVLADATGSPEDTVAALVEGTDLRLTLVAADGAVLVDSIEDPASMENHADRPEVREALAGRIGRDIRLSATQNVEQMYVAVPATYGDGRAVVRVSESLERISQLSASARRSGLILLAIAVAIALAVGSRVAASTARPVERLADAACAMASGDLSSDVPVEAGALRPLSSALGELRTQMRDRITDLEGEQRSLRAVLDGLTDAVFLLEGDTVRLTNKAAGTMFRAAPGDLRGLPLRATPLPASLVAAISAGLGMGSTVVRELDPDPLQRSLRVVVVPLDAPGERAPTLVIVSDITERVTLDTVRRDFVTNVSHELKTPTAGILLLAQSAARAEDDGDHEQALSFLGQIEHEADRLRHLVLDLLDLSRLETAPEPGSVTDMRQAIELSLSAHRRAAGAKGLALASDFSGVEGHDAYARADATDIAIALDNALANAVTYTERGGVTVRLDATGTEIVVTVSDTGIGIPPEHLPRVFERFYRVDRARSRDSGGTGLGLALVKHVVERSGGGVSVESTLGKGTSLRIRLPRAR